MKTATKMNPMSPDASGGRLVTVDGKTLPLVGATLRADARGGIARVVLEQRFANRFAEPLHVTYLMPLPADGAVSAYAFRIGERRIVGEVDKRAAARERFEEAIASGRSAALVEQERSSLFTQEIGNIPAGAEVIAELTIDQKLGWLDEGAWEWRFPTVAMPRYQGAAGRVADAARVSVDVADAAMAPRAKLTLAIRDAIADGRRAESPSHGLYQAHDGTIELSAEGGVALDRDIVVRWPVAEAKAGLTLDVSRPADGKPHADRAYGLLTLVPPARATRTVARDLCFLIDTSGSMGGEPLDQARRILMALVDTLGDGDSLEMIEFSSQPRRWKRKPEKATAKVRDEAKKWLRALDAGGGTEMRSGLMEALAGLRNEAQRQIVLVSDGAIGFESEIVADILRDLPSGSRVHTVGVGSAVNRSLTQPAARAGRGVEIIVGLGEDPERAARRIVARTNAPLVVDLRLEGSALVEQAPARAPDLFGGAPALLALALKPEGGELIARGRTPDGEWSERIVVPPTACGSGGAATALFGRERVEDLEMRRCAAGEDVEAIDRMVERIGVDFQIATRLTSWVAVDELPSQSIDPKQPSRKVRVPQELPHGVSVEGLGLRAPGMLAAAPLSRTRALMKSAFVAQGMPAPTSAARPTGAFSGGGGFKREEAKKRGAAKDDVAREQTLDVGEVTLEAPPTVRGRIVKHKGRELIVEIDVDGELDWAAGDDATVESDDGSATHARVDAARTTSAARVTAGQTIRLVLTLDRELTAPTTVFVGGLRIEVA